MIPISLLIALGSCATLNEAECVSGEWTLVGYEDGVQGRAPEFIAQHREACAEYGIAPDLNQYLAGRQRGLLQYCTPQKAYDLGRQARPVAAVCPVEQAAQLDEANFRGRTYRQLSDEIAELEREIDEYQRELKVADSTPTSNPVINRSLSGSTSAARIRILQLRARRAQYSSWR